MKIPQGINSKILVVDDEKEITEIFAELFDDIGFKNVFCTNSGLEAYSDIEKNDYDLVFLDILMPDLSGERIFNRLKKIKPNINVVFITGHADKELVNKLKKESYSFLYKPFQIYDIINILNSLRG